MSEIEKSELRRQLLEQMCYFAENIYQTYYLSPTTGLIYFDNMECPEPFKPGFSDKFIFNRIIDRVIDNVYEELRSGEYKVSIMGLNILAKFYYPQFGKWRTMPKLSHEEICRLFINK